MDILIRDAREKRTRLLIDIETLEKEKQDTNLKDAIDKNYDIIKNILQQHQEYIKEKKMRKLRRDANDYAAGRVFTFAHKYDNINHDNRAEKTSVSAAQTTSSITTSDTDLSSCSSVASDEASGSIQDRMNITHKMHIDLFKFVRKWKLLKFFHHKQQPNPYNSDNIDTCDFSNGDIRDIQTLLSIAEDVDNIDRITSDDILADLGITSSATCTSGLKPRSRFTPILTSDDPIDVFYKLVTKDLHNLENQYILGCKTWARNLNPQEQKALRSFDDIKDVVIKEADKAPLRDRPKGAQGAPLSMTRKQNAREIQLSGFPTKVKTDDRRVRRRAGRRKFPEKKERDRRKQQSNAKKERRKQQSNVKKAQT
ncbi:hypothetical protein NDU88_002821 [Pleurodeles waltl]|uniref:Uncharacterized protein n=1 Tax=Pleurodeles waltl TaxID=8319 RepID=A0AAV7W3H8_PLEWA|nr:hypothetical protein NDU88_002821 [Pleurodeles waltl]